jgi:hypothetical protein
MVLIQQIINRIGTLKSNVFGTIDFTAGYHQTPLHPDLQEYSGPPFKRSMVNKVLAGYITRICEIHLDDEFIHGCTDHEYLDNTRKKSTNRVRKKTKGFIGRFENNRDL